MTQLASGAWIDVGEQLALLGDYGDRKITSTSRSWRGGRGAGRPRQILHHRVAVNEFIDASDNEELSRFIGKYVRRYRD